MLRERRGAGRRPDAMPGVPRSGEMHYQQSFLTVRRTCSQCNGRGQIIRRPCKECKGEAISAKRGS